MANAPILSPVVPHTTHYIMLHDRGVLTKQKCGAVDGYINAEHLKQQHMGIFHETTDARQRLTWNALKEKNTKGNIRERWARAHQKINAIYMEREWVRNREREMRRCWSGGTQRWSETLKVKIERERYLTFQWQWDNG